MDRISDSCESHDRLIFGLFQLLIVECAYSPLNFDCFQEGEDS